jgi:hypothetical protein
MEAPRISTWAAIAYVTTCWLRRARLHTWACFSMLTCSWEFYRLSQLQHLPAGYAWYITWLLSVGVSVSMTIDCFGELLLILQENTTLFYGLTEIARVLDQMRLQWNQPLNENNLPPLKHGRDLKHMTMHCAVCQEDFCGNELHRELPCTHTFHAACVDPWLLRRSPTCPLCRHVLMQ